MRRLLASFLVVGAMAGGLASCGTEPGRATVDRAAGEAAAAGGEQGGADADFGRGPAGGPCRPVPAQPARAVALGWLPPGLPLPAGTYATEELTRTPAGDSVAHRGLLVVPGTVADFLRFAVASWPPRGWRLGRGESERGEAEDTFVNDHTGARGRFRVRSAYCNGHRAELLLQLVDG